VSPATEEDPKAIAAALRKSPLLAGLDTRTLAQLATFARVRNLAKDAVVVQQGDEGIGFYVLLSGRVQVRRAGKPVAELGPGEFFGEMALFDGRPRSADVVALEPATAVVLSRWEFWGFAANKPEVLRAILEAMARRLEPAPDAPPH
jgi:CRP/FNR family transcriptional regulator, cyclic AMP receptor protein